MRTRTRKQPTERDLEVLRYLQRHQKRWNCAPTRAEIAGELGISRPTAESHLQALEQCRLVRLRKQWRGIELTGRA